ncbi:MAG TPA: DUF1643 domain-containing protein [Flavobacteriales bacterium]|nr:DUF1643 domain-containing protein [Flavobacteriales bacterium]
MRIKQYTKKGAEISTDGVYRYSLWRIWDESKPLILFICLNPSTADATADDPTIRRCIAFARSWGYGGLYMGNLFAFRATNPTELYEAADPVGPKNDTWLFEMAYKCQIIVFAWGTKGVLLGRNKLVSSKFPNSRCITKIKAGHPGHPLYLRPELQLMDY